MWSNFWTKMGWNINYVRLQFCYGKKDIEPWSPIYATQEAFSIHTRNMTSIGPWPKCTYRFVWGWICVEGIHRGWPVWSTRGRGGAGGYWRGPGRRRGVLWRTLQTHVTWHLKRKEKKTCQQNQMQPTKIKLLTNISWPNQWMPTTQKDFGLDIYRLILTR